MKAESTLSAIIMAGGAGTRFWPLSTPERPKQFLTLFGERSLLQQSFDRISDIVPPERTLVMTNACFVDLVREQLPEIPRQNIIGEPMRKDTAAAVCLGALVCKKLFGDTTIATLTADHVIVPRDMFQKDILFAAAKAGQADALYTFGIPPQYPATGYGYLEVGELIEEDEAGEHYFVKEFKEKPDAATAEQYVKSGNYLWNSGMFVWPAKTILKEIGSFLPAHLTALEKVMDSFGNGDWSSRLAAAFETLDKKSIDHAVMEKSRHVRCIRAGFKWSDVGGWKALEDHLPLDVDGNHYRGRLTSHNGHGNFVFCDNHQETVAIVGVRDLVVVRVGDKTLIARKDCLEDLKIVVEAMGS